MEEGERGKGEKMGLGLGDLLPGAMMLLLMPNGTKLVANIFIKCVVAALLGP